MKGHYIYTQEVGKNKAFSPTCGGIFADFIHIDFRIIILVDRLIKSVKC